MNEFVNCVKDEGIFINKTHGKIHASPVLGHSIRFANGPCLIRLNIVCRPPHYHIILNELPVDNIREPHPLHLFSCFYADVIENHRHSVLQHLPVVQAILSIAVHSFYTRFPSLYTPPAPSGSQTVPCPVGLSHIPHTCAEHHPPR